MFLWASLVMQLLEDADSIQELKSAVNELPKGLTEIYKRILDGLKTSLSAKEHQKLIRVLNWMACSRRPLKPYELEWGTALHSKNAIISEDTRPFGNIVDLGKPLIEVNRDQSVVFVHSSVKE
jgi:hypothetical protein